MSIALIVTAGFGNGVLTGDLASVVLMGFSPGFVILQPLGIVRNEELSVGFNSLIEGVGG